MVESHHQIYGKCKIRSYITVLINKNNHKPKAKIYDYGRPFLRRADSFVSNCLLRDRLLDLIKSAFKVFLFFFYSRALVNTFHSKLWSGKYFKCSAV